jgi:hypothetical protein
VRLGNALKGHFSRGTTVPVFTVFMDPSPKARVFMKSIKCWVSCLNPTCKKKGAFKMIFSKGDTQQIKKEFSFGQ